MGRSEMVLTLPMVVYVDDCGFIGETKPELDAEATAFVEWSEENLGVCFKVSKRVLGSQTPHMIGFTWDSRSLTRSLGETKLHTYLTELLACGESRVLTLQQRQQIAGKMQRGAMALPPGAQCFVAHCFQMMHGLLYGHQKRRTTRAERQDYLLFHDLLSCSANQRSGVGHNPCVEGTVCHSAFATKLLSCPMTERTNSTRDRE